MQLLVRTRRAVPLRLLLRSDVDHRAVTMSATPMRDVRPLPFPPLQSTELGASRRSSLRSSALPPSPYTPFSGRRSGSVPPGTPQPEPDIGSARKDIQGDGTSAEEFLRGGLDAALRSNSVSILNLLSRGSDILHEAPELMLVNAMQMAICQQIEDGEALADHAASAAIRRDLDASLAALRAEEATWNLIAIVWRASMYRPDDLTAVRLAPDALDRALIDASPGVAKAHRIARWLESDAAAALDRAGGPRVKPLDDPAYRCAYTAQKRGVRALSIDFKGTLDETETKADERLCRQLFRLLRAGRIEQAERICRAAGQPWRAAILAGGKRCSAQAANGHKRAARITWRNAVAKLARGNSPFPPHERAIYAILAGVADPALSVAADYESRAWVRITSALDAACENALAGATGAAVAISDDAILQMFRECEGAANGHTAIPAAVHSGLRDVRSYFALGDEISAEHLQNLVEALGNLAHTGRIMGLEWVCRLTANLGVFLKVSELVYAIEGNEVAMSNFEEAVVSFAEIVISKDKTEEDRSQQVGTIRKARVLVSELAARVLSVLDNPNLIVNVYTDLMISALIEDLKQEENDGKRVGVPHRKILERRTVCLEQAGGSFSRETLDMLVLNVVEQIWEQFMPSSVTDMQQHVDEVVSKEDELIIRSLEFLMFPAFANYEQAVLRATTLTRKFFLKGKQRAARQLVDWFPKEVINHLPVDSSHIATNELDAWRMYMDALTQYDEWRNYFFTNRPIELPAIVREAALARRGHVSYEVQAAASVQLDKYKEELERYTRTSSQLRDAAVEALRTTLQYSGGWMRPNDDEIAGVDDADEMKGYEERCREIEKVRRIAVPDLVALLHNVLHESGLYNEATELATTVASDMYKLYECFGKAQLKAFLQKVADSAVLLADQAVKQNGVMRPYNGYFFEEFA